MNDLVAIVVRVVGVGGAGWVVGSLANSLSDKSGGANIGAGLLSFLTLLLASLVWSFFDGRAGGPLGRTILRWGIVAAVVAVSMALGIQVEGVGFDAEVLLSDLMSVSPLVMVLILGPASLGSVVGQATRRS